MSISYPGNLKRTLKNFEQFVKFCSFFQIGFSFPSYTVRADRGGPRLLLSLKEVVCVIEVKNLVKRYGDHYAVDHLSFTVEEGQIFGCLGPNGAR